VGGGEYAFLCFATHRYDLVLLDISMPSMHGLVVCKRIRADHGLKGLRVIAYTAHVLPRSSSASSLTASTTCW
jgi:CheY-like chemotaxis protein